MSDKLLVLVSIRTSKRFGNARELSTFRRVDICFPSSVGVIYN
jgi:hypothetical protein